MAMPCVAVVGAGLAGLATARALAAAGCAVQLWDDGHPAPQAVHVHRLPARLLQQDPALEQALHAAGARPGQHSHTLLPTVVELHTALRSLVRADARIALKPFAGLPQWKDAHWHWPASSQPPADWLVDASGARTATLPLLTARGLALAEERIAGRQCSRTQRAQGRAWRQRGLWSLRSTDGAALLCFADEAGRVTFTSLGALPADLDAALPEALHQALGPLQRVGRVAVWRAAEARRRMLDSLSTDVRWLAVGDALLHTPPWQGQGVAQAFAHAAALASALAQQRCPLTALDALASQQLLAASLGQWAAPAYARAA